MTNAEKITLKQQALDTAVAALRRVVRHNGAAISAKADLTEIAEHALEFDVDRVKRMWDDINTIDRVKNILHDFRLNDGPVRRIWFYAVKPNLTTEELLNVPVNDPTLVADSHSWAVVKITKKGTELLTYGGGYYQTYIDNYSGNQDGDTELLKKALDSDDAVWLSDFWDHSFTGREETYVENGIEYLQVPCELPGDLDKLQAVALYRKDAFGLPAKTVTYSLTNNSCTVADGMVGLPHGMWLIYDNSNLESAPKALLVPKELVTGNGAGYCVTKVEITYSNLVSGLERLRLVSDSFGDEYIVSSQDIEQKLKGTWLE